MFNPVIWGWVNLDRLHHFLRLHSSQF